MVIFIAGCMSGNVEKYDFTSLKDISIELKSVFNQMQSIADSSDSVRNWEENKYRLRSKLVEIQEAIDQLPPVEKDPEKFSNKKEVEKFNEKMHTARQIKNKLQEILDLLYNGCAADHYTYFETVAADYVIEARLENLTLRSEENGLFIPLGQEYQNLPLPPTTQDAEITVVDTSF
jgi:vacuolar-type H+-ATPase subunit I/STV1